MTERQVIADAIKNMKFGDLVDMASDMQGGTNFSWRTYQDEDVTPLDFASALHAWAEAQEADAKP